MLKINKKDKLTETWVGKLELMYVKTCNTSSFGADIILWAACRLSSWNCHTFKGANSLEVSSKFCRNLSKFSTLSGYSCLKIINYLKVND